MVAYCLEAGAVPFPVFVVSYFFNGFGTAYLVRSIAVLILSCRLFTARFMRPECRVERLLGEFECRKSVHTDGHSTRTLWWVTLRHVRNRRDADRPLVIGLGAMCSPLISTQFANLPRWSFVYLTHLGIAFLNGLMQIAVFRFKTQEGEFTGHRKIAHTGVPVLICLSFQSVSRRSASHPLWRSPRAGWSDTERYSSFASCTSWLYSRLHMSAMRSR